MHGLADLWQTSSAASRPSLRARIADVVACLVAMTGAFTRRFGRDPTNRPETGLAGRHHRATAPGSIANTPVGERAASEWSRLQKRRYDVPANNSVKSSAVMHSRYKMAIEADKCL
jgi:hypothetical protein